MILKISRADIEAALEHTGHVGTADNVKAVEDALKENLDNVLRLTITGMDLPMPFESTPLF